MMTTASRRVAIPTRTVVLIASTCVLVIVAYPLCVTSQANGSWLSDATGVNIDVPRILSPPPPAPPPQQSTIVVQPPAPGVVVQRADGNQDPIYHLANMHKQPWFWDVLAASVVGWVVGIVKGFKTSKDWLIKYWPSPPLAAVFVLDFLVFVCAGAYFGTGIYNPTSFLSALASGLSWPVGFGALATRD